MPTMDTVAPDSHASTSPSDTIAWTRQIGGAQSTRRERVSQTWDEFLAWFAPAEIPVTDKPKARVDVWIPARLGDKRDKHGNLSRDDDNVVEVTVGVGDLDGATQDQVYELHEKLKSWGLGHVVHSTYSHMLTCKAHNGKLHKKSQTEAVRNGDASLIVPEKCPPDCPELKQGKYRLAVQLSRPVLKAEWGRFRPRFEHFVLDDLSDAQASDPTRIYFVPARPAREPAGSVGRYDGKPLDVDVLLANPEPPRSQKVAAERTASSGPTRKQLEMCAAKWAEHHANDSTQRAGATLTNILTGVFPYAADGEHDAALSDLAFALARQFPLVGCGEDMLSSIGPECAQLAAAMGSGWDEGDAAAELERKIDDKLAIITREARAVSNEVLAVIGRAAVYSDAEIDAMVAQYQLQSREALTRQLVVVEGSKVRVLFKPDGEPADYTAPMPVESAGVAQYLAPFGPHITLREITPKGIVDKPNKVLVRDYGVVAPDSVASLIEQHSRWDRKQRRLVLACARRRDLTPRAHTHVAAWLRQLACTDDAYAALQDWLAVVTDLARPAPALYIKAGPGVGKTYFALSLARIWVGGQTGSTSLSAAMQQFNAAMMACPLVLGDEQIPEDRNGPRLNELKELIAATSHRLERKGVDSGNRLEGALRIVLAANNERMIDGRKGLELTAEDVAALGDRMVYIDATNAPKLTRAETDQWGPDDVAEHALWLRATRKVQGGRFACESFGHFGAHMLIGEGLRGALVTHIILAAMRGPDAQTMNRLPHSDQQVEVCDPGVLVIGGEVYACSASIAEQSDCMDAIKGRPSRQKLTSALDGLVVPRGAPNAQHESRNVFRSGSPVRSYRRVRMDLLLRALPQHSTNEPSFRAALAQSAARLFAMYEAVIAPSAGNVTAISSARRASQPPYLENFRGQA